MEDVTKATSCIDLTNVDNNEGYENFEGDQSNSLQGLPNPTTCRKLTHFLRELKGLTLYPITQAEIIDLSVGTDHQSYKKNPSVND